jgi:hypothetical protein
MTDPATMKALTRRLETALLDHFGTSNATTYTAREAGRIAACVVRNKAAALATALDTAAAKKELEDWKFWSAPGQMNGR